MDPAPSLWLVEAAVTMRNPWQASEESRRDFFEAIRSIGSADGSPAEVGWLGDAIAYVAAARYARSGEEAADELKATIIGRATVGARWRMVTGLQVTILDMRPAMPLEA